MKPAAVDLFCGLGGWAEGLLAEGWKVIGFDIERHEYGEHRYPGQLVVMDVLNLHGSWLKDADLIVASPPCQEYSYMAMPWKRAKAKAAAIRADITGAEMERLTRLFRACFRIQKEASEAAGRRIPMVVENVRGAQPWVGKAVGNFGSFYLWGDVPPLPKAIKVSKVPGFRFDGSGKSFQSASVQEHTKNNGGSWFNIAHNTTSGKGQNPDGRKVPSDVGRRTDIGKGARFTTRDCGDEGIKLRDQDGYERNHPNAFGWKSPRTSSGNVRGRKFASAMIAKIPLTLSRHIAVTFKPTIAEAAE